MTSAHAVRSGHTVKGRGDLETIASRSVLTNNGDIVLWSNSDNSGGGSVVLGDNNVLNSSNGRRRHGLWRGKITLAGGNGSRTNPTDTVHRQPEQNQAGNEYGNHAEIYSGGGDIIVKGSSTATGQADDRDESVFIGRVK